jgi:pimeloyl-ACP methyl ester carboxylesterase
VLADNAMIDGRADGPRLVVYGSRRQDGSPVAVSGTFIDNRIRWTGPGPRPVVVIGPGTVGQGDTCATSATIRTSLSPRTPPTQVLDQQLPDAGQWLKMGARVFITDYVGLGTPGIHTYTNRREGAHAILDGARAALRLSGRGPTTPIVMWGYSQGGGAAAAAAEMQPSYAPELRVKGTWAGAPVADLVNVLDRVDGTLIGGVIGWALNGLFDRYPHLEAALKPVISPTGFATMTTLGTQCVADLVAHHPFLSTTSLTRDRRRLVAHLERTPAALAALNDQRIGTLVPRTPVLITSARNDDTVPYGQARRLAADWCARGATVRFRTNELPPILPGATLPNHYGPQLADYLSPNSPLRFLLDRLADKPLNGCRIA